jgi:calcium-dependent protein kinase
MELCSGGDLYSRDPYTEDEAARIVSSILSAVGYMHSRKVVHRDLKYENILFVNDSPMAEIKLIDFGLSKKYASDKELTEGVGTVSELCLSAFSVCCSGCYCEDTHSVFRFTQWLLRF